jgi:predicted nucleotidyltransferase
MNPEVNDLLSRNRELVRELCLEQKVRALEIFGSATTAEFNPERSDLDFLVEFQDPDRPGLAEGLERIFQRTVDLVTRRSLKNPIFIGAVNRSMQVVYAG